TFKYSARGALDPIGGVIVSFKSSIRYVGHDGKTLVDRLYGARIEQFEADIDTLATSNSEIRMREAAKWLAAIAALSSIVLPAAGGLMRGSRAFWMGIALTG